MKPSYFLRTIAVSALFLLVSTGAGQSDELFVYCAAGMRPAVEKVRQSYEADHATKVQISYDGSNKLLGEMELTRKGDLYISGDADYVDSAAAKGFVASRQPVCWFVPVIMVQKGNPRGIKIPADLCAQGIKLGQGDENATAVGRASMAIIAKFNLDRTFWKRNVVLVTQTVNELANAVKLHTIDAAIVWNAVASSYPADADVVAIDPAQNVFPEVDGAVLTFSRHSLAASVFLKYVTSPFGKAILKSSGYTVEKP
jgi:molybdate transport system substrate-binding protein